MSSKRKPLVGVVCDQKAIDPHLFHAAGDKYLQALILAADVLPVLIPSVGHQYDIHQWLEPLDGLFLTGAYSMVDPALYQGTETPQGTTLDPARDKSSISLIKYASEHQYPMFAVCRGLQEMNVAFGGSLHQEVHHLPDFQDHREDANEPLDIQYGLAHSVTLESGGLLEQATGQNQIMVNSLHHQGIDQLGQGLVVEARADDGLIEAIRVKDSSTFALGVQWHPEWKVMELPEQRAIFAAFGDACRTKLSEQR